MIKKFLWPRVIKIVFNTVIWLIGSAIFFSSCKIYKPAYYFKDITRDTVISGFIDDDLELKIRKNDILAISVSSLNAEEDILFNKATLGAEGKSGSQVNSDGNIYVHKLGRVAVGGLTRKQLKTKLENDFLPFLKDPIVTINFANHRITVLGDGTSEVVEMPEEKISLLEVMSASKSVTINSQLNNVMIIRDSTGSKQVKHINLQDPSIFTSTWYYLQPNDIVVVKPNEEKINSEQRQTKNLLLFTTLLTATSFVILILDRIGR